MGTIISPTASIFEAISNNFLMSEVALSLSSLLLLRGEPENPAQMVEAFIELLERAFLISSSLAKIPSP